MQQEQVPVPPEVSMSVISVAQRKSQTGCYSYHITSRFLQMC